MKIIKTLAILALSIGTTLGEWPRHVIDISSRGADGVRLMDVNGDGLQDIAVGWEEGSRIRVYICPEESLRRSPLPSITVDKVDSPEDAVFVDINRDGVYDVLSSCEGKQRTVFAHIAPKNPSAYTDPSSWKTIPVPETINARHWMFATPVESPPAMTNILMGSKGANADIGLLQISESRKPELRATYTPLVSVGWIMSIAPADIDGDDEPDFIVSDRKGSSSGILWMES